MHVRLQAILASLVMPHIVPSRVALARRGSLWALKIKIKFFLLVATNLRAQAEFNPRAFHGVVAAPDASVCRRRKSPATGLPLPQQRGGRE